MARSRLRLVPLALLASLAMLGACGNKSFAPGTAKKDPAAVEKPGGTQTAEADAKDPNAALKNLSQDLLDKLKTTTSDEEATNIEQQVWDSWLVSGSATVDILMKRGLEYQKDDDVEAARDLFDRAIAIKPDYAEVWNRRAVLFFNDGKYDEAIKDLESALTYEPRHFGAWVGIGMIFESIDRPEAALKAYRKALAIDPHLESAKQAEKRLIPLVEGRPL
ncbi:MAG TPA: tetratricopeptide repeat protein [Hyphomonadaceae bacterium]|nr:tetratricopeptide repeat protein [Hyphomonadaceae bacterium]